MMRHQLRLWGYDALQMAILVTLVFYKVRGYVHV